MAGRRRSQKSLTLHEGRAIDAVASPHRLEIITVLGGLGEASIAELARQLGRTPHSLYYHMKLLEEAGVVVSASIRRRGRRDEQVWKLSAEKILLAASPGAHSALETGKAIESMMRLASRELQAAVARGDSGGEGKGRRTIGLRMKGRFDSKTLSRIDRLLEQIESLVAASTHRPNDGELFSLTVVMAPAEDKTPKEEKTNER